MSAVCGGGEDPRVRTLRREHDGRVQHRPGRGPQPGPQLCGYRASAPGAHATPEFLPGAVAALLPGDVRVVIAALERVLDGPPPRDAELLRTLGIDLDEVRSAVRQTFGDDAVERLRRPVHQPWQPWRRPSRRCMSLLAGGMGVAPLSSRPSSTPVATGPTPATGNRPGGPAARDGGGRRRAVEPAPARCRHRSIRGPTGTARCHGLTGVPSTPRPRSHVGVFARTSTARTIDPPPHCSRLADRPLHPASAPTGSRARV